MLSAGLLFLLTAAPGLVALVLIGQDAGGLPVAAICALPVGPAISAVLYTLYHRSGDLTDLHPARVFWRGYRTNLLGVLSVWAPLIGWLTVLAINLTYHRAAGLPGWWLGPLILVAVAATLWGVNAVVISSLFAFRVRDVARLAAYYLTRTPSVPVGAFGLLAVSVAAVALWSEAVLMLLVPVLALGLLQISRPMVADLREEFIA